MTARNTSPAAPACDPFFFLLSLQCRAQLGQVRSQVGQVRCCDCVLSVKLRCHGQLFQVSVSLGQVSRGGRRTVRPKNKSQVSSRALVRSTRDQIIDFPSEISSRESDSMTFPSVSSPVPGRFPPGENPSHFWATCPKIGLRRAPELSEKKLSTRIPLGEAWRGLEGPDVIFLFSNGPPKSSLRSSP